MSGGGEVGPTAMRCPVSEWDVGVVAVPRSEVFGPRQDEGPRPVMVADAVLVGLVEDLGEQANDDLEFVVELSAVS
jgi:hypothetical protein